MAQGYGFMRRRVKLDFANVLSAEEKARNAGKAAQGKTSQRLQPKMCGKQWPRWPI
jgi:hypothetical protein